MKKRNINGIINFQIKLLLTRVFSKGKIITSHSSLKNRCALSGDFLCCENSEIRIGRVEAEKNFHFSALCGGKIEFGDGVFFNRNCIVVARDSIKIGKQCSFGPNVCIYDHDHAFGTAKENGERFKTAPVQIGNNCWIGANSVILRGTTIGDNCVIGAGCVISGNIPPNSLVTSGRELVIRPIK